MPIRSDEIESTTNTNIPTIRRIPTESNTIGQHSPIPSHDDSFMFEYPTNKDTESLTLFQKLKKSNFVKVCIFALIMLLSIGILIVCSSLFFLFFINLRVYFYYFKYCTVRNNIDFCDQRSVCSDRNLQLDSKFINSTQINGGEIFFAKLKNDEYQLNISRVENTTNWKIDYFYINQKDTNITTYLIKDDFKHSSQFGILKIKRDLNSKILFEDYWLLCVGIGR